MLCDPNLVACQVEMLRSDLAEPWWVTLFATFVWPLITVLTSVLVAVGVSRHGRKVTMDALAAQLRDSHQMEATRLEEASTERLRLRVLDLMSEIQMHLFDSPEDDATKSAAGVASLRRSASALAIEAEHFGEGTKKYLRLLPMRYAAVLSAIKKGKPLADSWHSAWMAEAEIMLGVLLKSPENFDVLAAVAVESNADSDASFARGVEPEEAPEERIEALIRTALLNRSATSTP